MTKTLLTLTLLLALTGPALGQSGDVPSTLTVYAGGGYAHGLSTFDPPVAGVNTDGFAGSLRVMWKPEYLISAGLEVGHTDIYSIEQMGVQSDSGTGNVSATNRAWPIIIVFSMSPYRGIELQAGFGMAISETNAESFGSSVSAGGVGSAFMLSGAYLVPLSSEFRLGGEIKYTNMNKYDDQVLAVQLVLAYRLLEW
jgi:hypothetical protein